VHLQLFGLGVMPMFFGGFLMTAGARWLHVDSPPARAWAPCVVVLFVGWLLTLGAQLTSRPAVWAVGLLLSALGWMGVEAQLVRLRNVARPGQQSAGHFALACAALGVLTASLLACSVCVALQRFDLARLASLSGLWLGVAPVFIIASDRMLPFFNQPVPLPWLRKRERAVYRLALAACAALAIQPWVSFWASSGTWLSTQGAAGASAQGVWFAVQLAAAAVFALHAAAQREVATRSNDLLKMLLRAFRCWSLAWIAFSLASWPGLGAAARQRLDMAAIHILTLGFLGGTLIAMVSRVIATQAGRSVAIDRLSKGLELVLWVTLALRLVAQWPGVDAPAWIAAAAAAWMALSLGWAWRHLPMLFALKNKP
jgi:uncharacterized protein involved in response to NO